ncbi:AraC family transcriptional regulator [Eubacteriales bacterium OttesenSCG-928-G02]|nr:AraC family transcriptional regulator [Eubacteriales bacterium OttesenSCG-928-G02]
MITTDKINSLYTKLNQLRYIKTLIQYIESHLADELNPESIAERHYVSSRQLYRDFYACTGHSIKEYIRKRRISNACEKLKSSDLSLAVITDESGYETQQAFHKQFKSVVGITPTQYRQSDTYFYFHPAVNHSISFSVKVGTETVPPCSTIRFYDSCLIGIENKAIASLGEVSGRIFGRNGKQLGNRFCYELMTQDTGADKGEARLYATCTVNYNEPEINEAWNYLYNIWLSASMFEESGGGYFEEYLFRNGKPYRLKLYLPVKRKKTEHQIIIESVPKAVFIIARADGHDAERKASERVMAYLQKNNPLLLQNARRFYVCSHGDTFECGVECGEGFKIAPERDLKIRSIPAGCYAVLPDDRLGNAGVGAVKLERWIINNGIATENIDGKSEPVFAIYETLNGKFDNSSIRMKLYKRLKDGRNG